jgi:arylformamidase
MELYDVSLPLYPGMINWPGDPEFGVESVHRIADGDAANVSRLVLGSHSGTHIDAPRHFIEDAPGVDAIDPEILTGRARVFDLPITDVLDSVLLNGLDLKYQSRVLFKTRNSESLRRGEITEDYVCLTPEAASYLVAQGVKLVGIDSLSIEQAHAPGHPVHRTLLEAGVVIIEGLDLSDVPEGFYDLIALPLKVRDADGAPARVILKTLKEK